MSDVTDERLIVLVERAKAPPNTSQEIYAGELAQLVEEIKRHRRRAEHEHVYRVVMDVCKEVFHHPDTAVLRSFDVAEEIARRVASRLSSPVLSEEDVEQLRWNRRELVAWGQGIPVDVLDRLLAGKP